MPKITPTYDQKYLDSKFKDISSALITLETLIRSNTEIQTSAYQNILKEINKLSTSDVVMDRDIKDLKSEISSLKKEVRSNNFFSVKGVTFVVVIFAVIMTAFLTNGVDLLNRAL